MAVTSSTYQKRNILILLGFVIIISMVGGYFVFYVYPKEIKQTQEQQKRIESKIAALSPVEVELEDALQKIEVEKSKLTRLDKQIVAEVPSARTYAYLNSIIRYSGFLKFDMAYIRTENNGGYGYNLYRITGEGAFSNIYKFIWYLERGPEIYRITKLTMQGTERRDPENGKINFSIPFSLELQALYAEIKELPKIRNRLSDVRVPSVRKNPFYPHILKDVEPNTRELVEVDKSELKAVIPGKAFIIDQTGQNKVLKPGDRVYLGRTSKIDTKRNQVIFTLNKGGLIEKYVLKFDARTEQ
jgi:hypothetical protein